MYYIDNMNTERDIRNQIQFAADKGREEGLKKGLEEGKKEGREEGLKRGLEEGKKEGLKRGREEERKLMASKLKAMGVPIDTIIESSGLTREEIEKL